MGDVRFTGNWNSVNAHTVPKWYDDCKFGIFIHWGIYSGFGAFLSETGQGRRNYSAVYRMRMVATCARVAVALGERVVSVVPEIRPSPMAHFMASVA